MEVSENGGTPKMDNLHWRILLKMDDFGGYPNCLKLFLQASAVHRR